MRFTLDWVFECVQPFNREKESDEIRWDESSEVYGEPARSILLFAKE